MSGETDELSDRQDGPPNLLEAAEQLGVLLDLPSVDTRVTGVEMFGQGAGASVDIRLSNGETMQFASVRDMVRPQSLIAETVACSGATPLLKQPQAVQVARLARLIAERTHVANEDEFAAGWGVEFLQQAETVDVNLDDQVSRYAAFEHLSRRDPWAHSREQGCTYPSSCIVLRDASGDRLVRVEWFLRYVRSMDSRMTPSTLNARMMRVGWARRGHEGRIKARAAGRSAELVWAFWIVPSGWRDE